MRVGRGIGSGKGKTSGRGVKGQKARTGVSPSTASRAARCRSTAGSRSAASPSAAPKTTSRQLRALQKAIDAKKLDAGKTIDAEAMLAAGLFKAPRRRPPAWQGRTQDGQDRGEGAGASAAAIAAVEKAGGKVVCRSKPGRSGLIRPGVVRGRRFPRCRSRVRFHGIRRRATCRQYQLWGLRSAKATELKKRIWFTLGALIVSVSAPTFRFRASTRRRLPRSSSRMPAASLGMFDMFSGGALGRMTIFALNIMPYISASIIMQLLTAVSPSLEALKKEGEAGRKKINQYTRYGTVLLATFQAYGIAVGLESQVAPAGPRRHRSGHLLPFRHRRHAGRRHHVPDVAGRADHRARRRQRHLADHLRRHRRQPARRAGAYPGTRPHRRPVRAVHHRLLVIGVVASWPSSSSSSARSAASSSSIPSARSATACMAAKASHLPLKLNTAGVIPPIFASSLLLLPATIAVFPGGGGARLADPVVFDLSRSRAAAYLIAYVGLIVFFCFFYTQSCSIRPTPLTI
jgi:preprotein translocase subunit SecY